MQRIVYSTCSVHATENEHVVREALKSEEAQPPSGTFKLATPEDVLPAWERRGFPDEMYSPSQLKFSLESTALDFPSVFHLPTLFLVLSPRTFY